MLTHCNVSGELVAVAQRCAEVGKKFPVVATETRPYLQGARLTAWELAKRAAVSLIPDSAVAQVMAQGEVNAVIVGADRAAQNGDIINKVGTYPLALMAKIWRSVSRSGARPASFDEAATRHRGTAGRRLLNFRDRRSPR